MRNALAGFAQRLNTGHTLIALDFDAVLCGSDSLESDSEPAQPMWDALGQLVRVRRVTLVIASDRALGDVALRCGALRPIWMVAERGRVAVDQLRRFDTRDLSLAERLARIAETVGAEHVVYSGPHAYSAVAERPSLLCVPVAQGAPLGERVGLISTLREMVSGA